MIRRSLLALVILAVLASADTLEEGFRNPPPEARPHVYWLWLNGYVNPVTAREELQAMKDAGIGGVLLFDMGARGDKAGQPPAGPQFLSTPWMKQMKESVSLAKQLGLQVDFSVISSWDLGGHWIKPEQGSLGLYPTEATVEGGRSVTVDLPFPEIPAAAPKGPDGKPLVWSDVAVLAVKDAKRLPGHEFVLRLDPDKVHSVREVVLDNGEPRPPQALANTMTPVREFSVAVSSTGVEERDFHEVLRGSLKPEGGPQRFPLAAGTLARYVRLRLLSGQDTIRPRWTLGEFAVLDSDGVNVAASRLADNRKNGALMLRTPAPLGFDADWNIDNLNDGDTKGPRGVFAPAGLPAFSLASAGEVIDVTSRVGRDGKLNWNAPAGHWTILRYVCMNTGERLKVPSPNSDGWATDHLSAAPTRAHMSFVLDRLKETFGDLKTSGLSNLYLASYEVKGPVWTTAFLEEFQKRRGYDMKPWLSAVFGAQIQNEQQTERFLFDYRKTLGELLVSAYYDAAREVAHEAGLGIKSEAGGPGPPVHNVPVDALLANGAVDQIQGEFWPFWPSADSMWVVKETASAGHIYGKPLVHMEAFTSTESWREGPQDLKPAADRVFVEGGNHMVWHTWTHSPPEAGYPGWVYYAGTHLNRKVTWWPKAKPFLSYLARSSYLLQRGKPVADVLYYYGDGGYKFVGPRKADPSLGRGFDYDVTNSDVILHRLRVENKRFVLPDGMSYAVLVLPQSQEANPAVLAKIEQFVSAGGTVIGPKPSRAVGLEGYPQSDKQVREIASRLWDGGAGKKRVLHGVSIRDVLAQQGIGPDFIGPDSLDYIHRRGGEQDIYFVRNNTSQPVTATVQFRVSGRVPELWDPLGGDIETSTSYRAAGKMTEMPVALAPNGSIFVVFRQAASGSAPQRVSRGTSAAPIEVSDRGWSIEFEAGRGAPAKLDNQALGSWTNQTDPGVRYFSGTARYRTTFAVPADWKGLGQKVVVDLGNLWNVGEAWLNGKSLGIAWTFPFALDGSTALQPGTNELIVEVTNTWANRLIGEAKLPQEPRLTKTNVTTSSGGKPWSAFDPHASGLFGPVRIRLADSPQP